MIFKKSNNHMIMRCDCGDMDHSIEFYYEEEANDLELMVQPILSQFPLLKRIKLGIMYIFGKTGAGGHFFDSIFNVDDAVELRDYLDRYIESKKK